MRLFIDECLSPKFSLDLAQLGHDAIHPLHVGPQTSRARGWALITAALSFLDAQGGDPMDAMVNHYLDFDAHGRPALHSLSAAD